jgi:hypothetical protein
VGRPEGPGVNGIVDHVTGSTVAVNSVDPTGKTTHTTFSGEPRPGSNVFALCGTDADSVQVALTSDPTVASA